MVRMFQKSMTMKRLNVGCKVFVTISSILNVDIHGLVI